MSSVLKSDINNIFGKIFKDYRTKNGLTQEQLAEKLDISLKYISRIENGYSGIKIQTLINYINILGIPPNMLFSSFITNNSLKPQIELSDKLNLMSQEDIILLNGIADLLINHN